MLPKWFDKNSKEVFSEEEFAYEKFKPIQFNKFPYDNFYHDFEVVKKVGNIQFWITQHLGCLNQVKEFVLNGLYFEMIGIKDS